jgi:transketolase
MPLGSLQKKFEAFGWLVHTIEKGNQIDHVVSGLKHAKTLTGQGKPVLIIMHTEMGYGVDFMMGSHKWHGIPPSDSDLENALNQLAETIGDY